MRKSLSQLVINTCLAMNSEGINQGRAGNVSVRFEEGFLITPSGLAYDRLSPDDIVYVGMDGAQQGPLTPSSEWRMHRDIYVNRAEAGAVLHALWAAGKGPSPDLSAGSVALAHRLVQVRLQGSHVALLAPSPAPRPGEHADRGGPNCGDALPPS